MVSAVDVCNMALGQLGKPEITSLDERSTAAAWVRRTYDTARRDALSRSDWVFARGTTLLQGVLGAAGTRFRFSYALPPDFVKVRAVGGDASPHRRGAPWEGAPYELAGQFIFGMTPLMDLTYTRDVTNPDHWPSGFMEAVALKLASMIAMQATGRSDAAVNLQKLYENQLLTAIETDASQERRVWTDSEEDTICHDPHEAHRWPDYPYDATTIWVPGPAPHGTPVSAGGGAAPKEIVYIYEEGAGVDTNYIAIYNNADDPPVTDGVGDPTPADPTPPGEHPGGGGGTDTNYITLYDNARTT